MRAHTASAAIFVLVAALPACRGVGSSAIGSNTSGSSPAAAGPEQPESRDVSVKGHVGTDPGHAGDGTPLTPRAGNELAAFAAGCFWGVEDNFRQVPGVVATAVGYSNGHTDHPTYPSVCTHTTGHAETVLVEFNPKLVTYATLLNVFFKNHDPTTMNRQGPDVGDQYRSAIFTMNPAQADAANGAKDKETAAVGRTVVTIVEPLARFWKAEEYHQQYDEKTGTHSCPLPRGLPAQGT
jgi:peptide-methionine (S)-S-oxide reductase